MAIDSPAKIAVLGAGPLGLEAALYARFLGYEIEVFDRGDVASNVRDWKHVTMFTPFEQNSTSLALAALEAQGNYQPPPAAAKLTGGEFVEQYLLPLSKTDLLDGAIRPFTEVIAIRPADSAPEESHADAAEVDRPSQSFSIVTRGENDTEELSSATIVIDTTNDYGAPRGMAANGDFVEGQTGASGFIDYHVPNIQIPNDAGRRDVYEGKKLLVVGSGELAALAIFELASLCARSPETRIVWCSLGQASQISISRAGRQIIDDAIQVASRTSNIEMMRDSEVRSIVVGNDDLDVTLKSSDGDPHVLKFDRIVVCKINNERDGQIWSDLNVSIDTPSDGMITSEPNFYILGSKSRASRGFLLTEGHQQIRQLFSIIGGREDLDLYRSIKPLGNC